MGRPASSLSNVRSLIGLGARALHRTPLRPRGFEGYDRILHFHIQKSGGTSVNQVFYGLTFVQPVVEAFLERNQSHPFFTSDLFKAKSDGAKVKAITRRLGGPAKGNGYIVSSSWKRIRLGMYSYAHNHMCFQDVPIYPGTYSFTILREPLERLISRYKMDLRLFRLGKIGHYKDRGPLADSITEPLKYFRVLKNHAPNDFLNQIGSFSKSFTVDEAIENALSLNRILFQHSLQPDLDALLKDVGLQSAALPNSKSSSQFFKEDDALFEQLRSDACHSFLSESLQPEYRFYEGLQAELLPAR